MGLKRIGNLFCLNHRKRTTHNYYKNVKLQIAYLLEEIARGVTFEKEKFAIATPLQAIVSIRTVTVALDASNKLLRIACKKLTWRIFEDFLGALVEFAVKHRLEVLVLGVVDST